MNFTEAMNYINSFSHSGKKVKDLSRITGLLKLIGNPHKKLKFVHIAGTNGKGSVLEYCSNTFINAGIKTGQFTSPYMLTYCDRIRINGINIPEKRVAEICGKVKNAVKSNHYSQFEISFAIALLYFLEENCEIVFLETGIGGTLDATNIIEKPLVCVVTSVSFDHTAILGNTVEEIALHKLGIVKERSPLVLSCNNTKNVINLAEKITQEKDSKLTVPDVKKLDISKNNIYGTSFRYKDKEYNLKMCGEHQVVNALTAVETLDILKNDFNISQENIEKSFSDSHISSRIEVFGDNPTVIIDGGHNEAGIDSLINILKKSGIDKTVIVFGMVEGKAVDYAVDKLADIAEMVYCVDGYINNSVSAKILAEKFCQRRVSSEFGQAEILNNAFEYAKQSNIPLLICGSLYLASSLKNILQNI